MATSFKALDISIFNALMNDRWLFDVQVFSLPSSRLKSNHKYMGYFFWATDIYNINIVGLILCPNKFDALGLSPSHPSIGPALALVFVG